MTHVCLRIGGGGVSSRALTVVVRGSEGVISYAPPWGKDDKVSNGNSRAHRLSRQHSEDGGILGTENGRGYDVRAPAWTL